MDSRILITLLLCLASASSSSYSLTHRKVLPIQKSSTTSYAVIFDGGSTGTRLHVFRFNQSVDLLHVGDDLELYSKVKPGLSSYANEPEEAAESLVPLLEKAENVIPSNSYSQTPVIVGATAGLRSLEGNASELILEAVREMLVNRSSFKVESDAVGILSGAQEGSYLWVTVNYLLNNLGKDYSETIGVIDLGGGSVQMAYAISEENAANAPSAAEGDDPYITEVYLRGTKYYIYVYSYLNYGKEVSRAKLLNLTGDSGNPCILAGYNGTYEYEDVEYKASALPNGSNFDECRNLVLDFLNVNASCAYKNCTFGGIWSGGGGEGQKNLYLATSFYYLATEAGFADINKTSDQIRLVDYKIAAELACKTTYGEANSTFPLIEDDVLQYVCLDLVYQYTLLVDGFGLDPWEVVTVVDQIEYEDSSLDASWALGCAIEVVSSLSTFEPLMYVV